VCVEKETSVNSNAGHDKIIKKHAQIAYKYSHLDLSATNSDFGPLIRFPIIEHF
jgi:hypothetical protein